MKIFIYLTLFLLLPFSFKGKTEGFIDLGNPSFMILPNDSFWIKDGVASRIYLAINGFIPENGKMISSSVILQVEKDLTIKKVEEIAGASKLIAVSKSSDLVSVLREENGKISLFTLSVGLHEDNKKIEKKSVNIPGRMLHSFLLKNHKFGILSEKLGDLFIDTFDLQGEKLGEFKIDGIDLSKTPVVNSIQEVENGYLLLLSTSPYSFGNSNQFEVVICSKKGEIRSLFSGIGFCPVLGVDNNLNGIVAYLEGGLKEKNQRLIVKKIIEGELEDQIHGFASVVSSPCSFSVTNQGDKWHLIGLDDFRVTIFHVGDSVEKKSIEPNSGWRDIGILGSSVDDNQIVVFFLRLFEDKERGITPFVAKIQGLSE